MEFRLFYPKPRSAASTATEKYAQNRITFRPPRLSSWLTTTRAVVSSHQRTTSRSPHNLKLQGRSLGSICWITSSSIGRHTSAFWKKEGCNLPELITEDANPAFLVKAL